MLPANASLERVAYEPLTQGEDAEEETRTLGITLEGQVFGDKVQTLAALDQLIHRLERSLLFSRVRLEETRDLGDATYTSPGLSFRMTGFPAQPTQKVPS